MSPRESLEKLLNDAGCPFQPAPMDDEVIIVLIELEGGRSQQVFLDLKHKLGDEQILAMTSPIIQVKGEVDADLLLKLLSNSSRSPLGFFSLRSHSVGEHHFAFEHRALLGELSPAGLRLAIGQVAVTADSVEAQFAEGKDVF